MSTVFKISQAALWPVLEMLLHPSTLFPNPLSTFAADRIKLSQLDLKTQL